MSTLRVLSATALVAVLLSPTAGAAPISYASFSGTVVDFDGLAGSDLIGAGEAVTNQFAGLGVTFSVPNFSAHATTGTIASSAINSDPNVVWVDQGSGTGGALALGLNIDFSTPRTQVGLLFITSPNSTATLSAYSGATLLETITVTLPPGTGIGPEGFVAVSNTNITRVVVSSASASGQNWNFTVDDVKFAGAAVPEPGTLLLFGAGLGVMMYRRRRISN